MAAETELLDSTGLTGMLRDPNTGEVLHLIFPSGQYEIPLEVHLPARVAKVKLRAVKIPGGGEYDVRLVFDTNPPPAPKPETTEPVPSGLGSLPTETVIRTETPAGPLPPPVTSVIAPKPSEVTVVAPLPVEPSVPPPEAPQAQGQASATLSTFAPDGSGAPVQSVHEPPKAPTKEATKGSGQRNR